MATQPSLGKSRLNQNVALVCFAVLGALTARRTAGSLPLVSAFGCAFTAWFCLKLLGWLVSALNAPIRQQHGSPAIKEAIFKGFLLMVPFTVLALMADLWLKWSAVQAFTSAGIMTASAAVGADLVKLGGRKLFSMVLPSLFAFGFSAVWMILSAWLQAVWRHS